MTLATCSAGLPGIMSATIKSTREASSHAELAAKTSGYLTTGKIRPSTAQEPAQTAQNDTFNTEVHTMEIFKTGETVGNGAAINVELGWIPDRVEVYNATDGTPLNVGY